MGLLRPWLLERVQTKEASTIRTDDPHSRDPARGWLRRQNQSRVEVQPTPYRLRKWWLQHHWGLRLQRNGRWYLQLINPCHHRVRLLKQIVERLVSRRPPFLQPDDLIQRLSHHRLELGELPGHQLELSREIFNRLRHLLLKLGGLFLRRQPNERVEGSRSPPIHEEAMPRIAALIPIVRI